MKTARAMLGSLQLVCNPLAAARVPAARVVFRCGAAEPPARLAGSTVAAAAARKEVVSGRALSPTSREKLVLPELLDEAGFVVDACERSQLHDVKTRLAPSVKEYWQEICSGLARPTAREQARHLDFDLPLGVSREKPGGRRDQQISNFPDFMRWRLFYPRHVILVQAGLVYEAVGFDAVVLMEHCGLPAVSPALRSPRSRFAAALLRRTLTQLVDAGFSVAVIDSVQQAGVGYLGPSRPRVLAGVVSSAAPDFLNGLAESTDDAGATDQPSGQPIVGAVVSLNGVTLAAVDPVHLTIEVAERLSWEDAWARIAALRPALPVLLHRQPGAVQSPRLSGAPIEREFELRTRSMLNAHMGCPSVRPFTSADPLAGFRREVLMMLGEPPDTELTRVQSGHLMKPKGATVFNSTAEQLGLARTEGIPSLLSAVLPAGSSPKECREVLLGMLLRPPAPAEAHRVRAALDIMRGDMGSSLPRYCTHLRSGRLVRFITERQVNHALFLDIADMLQAVADSFDPKHPRLRAAAEHVLACVTSDLAAPPTPDVLLSDLRAALRDIRAVVADGSEADGPPGARTRRRQRRRAGGGGAAELRGGPEVFDYLRQEKETDWRVHRRLIAAQVDAVSAAAAAAREELESAHTALQAAWQAAARDRPPGKRGGYSAGLPASTRPQLVASKKLERVWPQVSASKTSAKLLVPVVEAAAALGLQPNSTTVPKGKAGAGLLDSPRLIASQDEWQSAFAAANAAATRQLRELAGRLAGGPSLPALAVAAEFSVLMQALVLHAQHAGPAGWSLPELEPLAAEDAGGGGAAEEEGAKPRFVVRGMWPYWMDGRESRTVTNDVELGGMALLTGPNMAGKSTVLRSLCAVALLANCGLMVPARQAAVPRFDGFVLRNFSGDAPSERMSAFGMEIRDMSHVLSSAGPRSLVLVDELGKGTEVRAGTALAGAMLEALVACGCAGVFATHLHLLHGLPLSVGGLARWRMEVGDDEWRQEGPYPLQDYGRAPKRPTWRVLPGVCTESLALEVALACRVPRRVAQRAAALMTRVVPYRDLIAWRGGGAAGQQPARQGVGAE